MATLVLTRRAGESVLIGPDIRVTVGRSARDGAMRLIIDAPLRVKILREELKERGQGRDATSAGNARR